MRGGFPPPLDTLLLVRHFAHFALRSVDECSWYLSDVSSTVLAGFVGLTSGMFYSTGVYLYQHITQEK